MYSAVHELGSIPSSRWKAAPKSCTIKYKAFISWKGQGKGSFQQRVDCFSQGHLSIGDRKDLLGELPP